MTDLSYQILDQANHLIRQYELTIDPELRKITGSHYTPTGLAVELARPLVQPVFQAAWGRAGGDPGKYLTELWGLKGMDPAAGGGILLLALGIEIACEIATVELTGSGQPSDAFEPISMPYLDRGGIEKRVRELLPRVVSECLFGVDLNPVSVQTLESVFREIAGAIPKMRVGDGVFGYVRDPGDVLVWDRSVAEAKFKGEWDRVAKEGDVPSNAIFWDLDFPEVFDRARSGFDLVIANPPFVGSRRLNSFLGAGRKNLLAKRMGSVGDLCGAFVLLTPEWLNEDGCAHFITTNTIAQASVRKAVLVPLVAGKNPPLEIYRACKSREWPEDASVYISTIAFCKPGTKVVKRCVAPNPDGGFGLEFDR